MHDPVQVCDVLVATFAARHDAYTKWNGQHWTAIPEPLTGEVAYHAIETRIPVSGYTIAPGSVTHVWAFDLDVEDGWDLALRVGKVAWEVALPAYAEQSRRGAHLWGVLDEQVAARTVRRAMRRLLQLADVPEDPKIEFRPAQDDIPDGHYGNSLRLPTMPHPKTGRRSPLYDPRTGEALAQKLGDMLLRIDAGSPGSIESLARSYLPPPIARYLDETDRALRIPNRRDSAEPDESISDLLRDLFHVGGGTTHDPYPQPGKVVRCPAHQDGFPSLKIFFDDRRVLCHSSACEWNNGGHGIGTYQMRQWFFSRPVDTP